MAPTSSTSAMQRKLSRNREGATPVGERPLLKALRLALARAASEVFDLPLAVIDAKQSRLPQDQAASAFGDDRLLILLDGPDRQAGAICLDHILVTSLIQQQTMGYVGGGAPPIRPFTDTDAALIAPLIDEVLSQAVELTGAPADRKCLTGYRFGARVDDGRSAALVMEAEQFRVFKLTVDISAGLQQGGVDLIVPDQPAESSLVDPATGADLPPAKRLSDAVMSAPVELTAVLCRLRLPLADLAAMRPGEVLPLNTQRFDRTELLTIAGQCIAVGRLGQSGGFRAVRVKETKRLAPNSYHAPDEKEAEPRANAFEAAGERSLSVEPQPEVFSQLPAISAGTAMDFEEKVSEDETDDLIGGMTPEQAAHEISELAGLSEADVEDEDLGDQGKLAAAS